jgi:hypothetical protein
MTKKTNTSKHQPNKIKTDKKRQHYIWKHYLKPWTFNKKIWCKRHDTIFNPSLKEIAQKKYFYELKPLNDIELIILTNFIKKTPIENHKLLIKLLAQYFYIGNSPDEKLRKYGIEDYHSRIEQSAIPLLDFIYKKDLSFLNDTNNKINFFYFISLQYHRTRCMLENAVTGLNNLPVHPPPEFKGKYSNENIVKAFSFLFAECTGI